LIATRSVSSSAGAMPECWFASLPGAGPCDGRLVRCHLIPKNKLRDEFRYGVVLEWHERPGGLTLTTSLRPARKHEEAGDVPVVCDACRSGEIDRAEGRCGVCGSSFRWDLEVLADSLAPDGEG
jgi:hypothetical protein